MITFDIKKLNTLTSFEKLQNTNVENIFLWEISCEMYYHPHIFWVNWNWVQISPVQYAKFLPIRYFIDIDIFPNLLIDIDINIFQNLLIDINIFPISLSIFLSISIFSKKPYRYFVDINIFTKGVDISSIFRKMPIYRQSISIFHQKNMKKSQIWWKKWFF